MNETVEIFGKSYGVFEMTHADKVTAWLRSAPTVEIQVGRYTLTYSYEYSYESNWEMCWVCKESVQYELNWENTPESNYFNEICHAMRGGWIHDIEYIDKLLDAMKKKPFNQGE